MCLAVLAAALACTGTVLAEDPATAARAIGHAGNAAAASVARDLSNAAEVPGYAGHEPAGAEHRRRTAPGRGPGPACRSGRSRAARPVRAVRDGAHNRPPVNVPATDPEVVRSEGIAATPQAAAHRADGLASGSVQDCDATACRTQRRAACADPSGSVSAAAARPSSPEAGDGFVEAATKLNMVMELGGDEFDRGNLRFFTGQRRACTIRWGGLANCCKNSGLLVGLGNCSPGEVELARERNQGHTHYLGQYCARDASSGSASAATGRGASSDRN